MTKTKKYTLALRYVGMLFVALAAVTVLVVGEANSGIEYELSPAQVTADQFPCTPTAEGELPSTVIVLPEGETEPVQSAELVGPALEYIFEGGPYIGNVMDFCK